MGGIPATDRTAAGRVAVGEAALAAGHWVDARVAFEAALEVGESAEASAGLGESLWWLCDFERSVRCRERAFVLFVRAGEPAAACRVAVDVAISQAVNLGNAPAGQGWLSRAARLVTDHEMTEMQGWIALVRGFLAEHQAESKDLFASAIEHGRAAGDVDLELVGLADLGLVLVHAGDLAEGIALLDEAMAGTLGGECRRPDTVVWTSCDMLEACSVTGDLERARQWCRAAEDFMQTYGCPFLGARCRAHYGRVLLAKGEWARAEEELRAALRLADLAGPAPKHDALAALATLRLRQGRLEESDTLAALVDDPVSAAVPAASLRLVRGQWAAAAGILGRLLDAVGDDHPESAYALGLLVQAHLGAGDRDAAGHACARYAGDNPPITGALAALARGRVAAAKGEHADAEAELRRAVAAFGDLALPWEAACARLELAKALSVVSPDLAVAEASIAHRTLSDLGAGRDADDAAALVRALGGTVVPSRAQVSALLTRRELEVLHLLARGLSNPEIAERLFISRKTASHHVSHILAKLGARNRAEAVAYVALHPDAFDPAG